MILEEKIKNKKANIGVIGLGYVGLPLAISASFQGYKVIGIDKDKKKIRDILIGKSYIKGISDEEIIKANTLNVTDDVRNIEKMDVIIICVPTPLDGDNNPNLRYIREAVSDIKENSKRNCLIILESTTYPGTTEEIVKTELENAGWTLGRDFHLCFSPERIDPGNKLYHLENTPKVVGGITKKCTDLGYIFYKQITKEVRCVSTASVAEMSKLLENTFRFINIAFINEMALICDKMGINIWEAIGAASTKPFGFIPFYPGPGVGGHCIPIDPIYLNWKAKSYNTQSDLIDLASKINEGMPKHIVDTMMYRLQKIQISKPKILVLGVAYKKDIDDIRESPAINIIERLMELDVKVDFYDPYIKEIEVSKEIIKTIDSLYENLSEYDCILIITNHSDIKYDLIAEKAKLIYDTRNSFKQLEEKIVTLGGGLVYK